MRNTNVRKLTRRQMLQRAALSLAIPGRVTAKGYAARGFAMQKTSVGSTHTPATRHPLVPVPVAQVVIDDGFWSPKRAIWRDVTIDDCLTKFENDRGGAINNFDLVRDGKTGQHAGPAWYDGLIYEMIRGCADFLASERDPKLEARLDGYITRIIAAQAKDPSGYLNTWTQSLLPQTERWGQNGGDDRGQHDVYNAGMMIEAGGHYYRATGKTALLQAATRMANLMCDTFGPAPKANVVPGHSGPEEALVQLYVLYRDDAGARKHVNVPVNPQRYLQLAEFFVDQRGHYEGRTGHDKSFGEYGQDHAPLDRQTTLEGHAVRATLFATGIVAIAQEDSRADYLAVADRFWDSLTRHKLYVSGAAGAIAGDEKLGPNYFLPNDGYMETCAAVGVGFFSRNLNLLSGDARYIDELERALYNAALGGVALAGNRYYYQNPLAGDGLRRWEWHDCPCCPPMFLKLMGALPGYIYAQSPDAVYVNLFIGSEAKLTLGKHNVRIRQRTRYPWDGAVTLEVTPDKPAAFDLLVRLPDWTQTDARPDALYRTAHTSGKNDVTLTVNGEPVPTLEMVRGYARLHRTWKAGDTVALTMEMPVRQVTAQAAVEADRGRVALMRGPLLYCAESVDNPSSVASLVVPPQATLTTHYKPDLLGGVAVVQGTVEACRLEDGTLHTSPTTLTAIPFYASANRAPGALRVWLAATFDKATPATLATRSRASASHCWHLDSIEAINDGIMPERSSDTSKPRLSWWDHKGTTEWAELAFSQAERVAQARVFWFADRTVGGGCDAPRSWRVLYQDGDGWKPVASPSGYETALDRFNTVTFAPVQTTALRIEVTLQPEWSGGICEWQIE